MEAAVSSSAGSSDQKPAAREVIDLVASSDDEGEPSAKRRATESSVSASLEGPSRLPLLPFYLGAVRGLSPTHNEQCLAIEDVFSGDFSKAVLMNFMVDLDWLCDTLPRLRSVPWLCVFDKKGSLVGQRGANMQFFMPRLEGPYLFGTHHSKMALLWYRDGVRVMVATGNYIEIDWRNKTEGVFVQDFPFLPAGSPDDTTGFGKDLRDYLQKLNGFENEAAGNSGSRYGHPRLQEAITELKRVDFSAAQAILIPSVPGKHTGQDFTRYGHLKLRRILTEERVSEAFNPSTAGEGNCGVISQFSSMGSHAKDGKWVKEEFEVSLKAGSPGSEAARLKSYLVWPRMTDVQNSNEGWRAGGAMPCQPKNVFDNADIDPHNFGRNRIKPYLTERLSLFQADSWGRQRAMPHLKSFCRFVMTTSPSGKRVAKLAWAMICSQVTGAIHHIVWPGLDTEILEPLIAATQNYSKVAWGELMDRGRIFKIQSFEMGVLLLPSRYPSLPQRTFSCTPDHPLLGLASPGHKDTKAFVATSCQAAKVPPEPGVLPIPIPYTLPPTRYNPATDQPWVSGMASEDRDTYGFRKVVIAGMSSLQR